VEGSALVAVMRRDAAKAADYASRHGVARWYDDAAALIHDSEVDAVYIATPPSSHESYALHVCAAGKPCYVEKPMARNASEAQRMVDAFEAAKLPLYVAYYRRGLPRFVEAKRLLDSGVLGELRSVSYRYQNGDMRERQNPIPWRLDPKEAGAGLFLDLGSHALDLLDFLLGPATDVVGAAANAGGAYNIEDSVSLSFATPRCRECTALWNFTSDVREDEYCFVGDDAELRFSCFGNEPLRLIRGDSNIETFDRPNPPHIQQPLIQSIVEDLQTGSHLAPSTGASALRTQIVMDQALEKFYGGREDGFWQRFPVSAV